MIARFARVIAAAAFFAALVGVAPLARAGSFGDFLIANGDLNFFEDNSREAYYDVNGNGKFDSGDVLIGFLQVENGPGGVDLQGTTYAIFSQTVDQVDGFTVTFKATDPTSDFSLQNLGVTGAEDNALVALYYLDGGTTDLTTTELADLQAYFDYIQTGELQLTLGLDTVDDYFVATVVVGSCLAADLDTGCLGSQESSQQIASFGAVMSILTDNVPNFDFADDVCQSLVSLTSTGPLVFDGCGHLTLVNGNVGGAANLDGTTAPATFKSLAGVDVTQCGADNATTGEFACGFIDNADFNLRPIAVPEPASMLLFGIGLLGVGIYGRKRSRKSE